MNSIPNLRGVVSPISYSLFFLKTTLFQKIEYNMTGADKFVEIVGSHTFSKNYMTGPCTGAEVCGQELHDHFYTIPPGPLYPKLYSNPLAGIDCSDPCFWKLDGNSNVDDFYNFIGPTKAGEDFIVKARSDAKGLTERIRVKHNGGIDLKVGNWDESYPQITLDDGGTAAPTIRFYRNSGNPSDLTDVYPFWIQGNIGSSGGLRFLSQEFSNFRAPLGTETPVIRFKINYNGNLGVNKEVPTARFQVTEGNVLFDGKTTSSFDNLPSGAGNRFLWAAEKSALRAGEVTGSQWNNSNIGTHSAAFGLDNTASGSYTLVGGKDNFVPGNFSNAVGLNNKVEEDYSFASGQVNSVLADHASAFGLSNTIKGDYSFASGASNTITGEYSYASGYDNYVDGNYAAAFGRFNDVTGYQAMAFGINNDATSTGSVAFGINNKSEGVGSIAFGNTSFVTNASSFGGGFQIENYGANSFAYGDGIEIDENSTNCNAIGEGITIDGNYNSAFGSSLINEGHYSTAMGNRFRVEHKGSFVIGDFDGPSSPIDFTTSENINEITLRFTGDLEGESNSTNKCYRFITELETDNTIKNGVFLHRGGNSWGSLSDRNLKKNIQDIDNHSILENLRQVQIKTWQWRDGWTYKDTVKIWDDFSHTWLGPMAQDFNSKFSNFGTGDNTKLNSATMDAVMFASIQALADMVDSHSQTLTSEKEKIDSLDNYTKELLTKSEFEGFKNEIDCLDSVCERVSTLETNYTDLKNNSSTFLTKSEFNSFKDPITCYADACKRIKDLEDTIESLKKRLDELEGQDSSGAEGPKYNQNLNFNFGNLENNVILEQNNPNPFSDETKINYYIPSDFSGQAELMLSDEKGSTVIKKLEACIGKPCSITISAEGLNTGVYVYALLLDGKIIKSQKMMIIK